jgi:hypothetical protein
VSGLRPTNLLLDPGGGGVGGAHLAPSLLWEQRWRNLFLSLMWGPGGGDVTQWAPLWSAGHSSPVGMSGPE